MPKKTLTPGNLYARLSAEFRRLRPAGCQSCNMPMLYAIERVDGDYANWRVEHIDRVCHDCLPVVADIVRRHAAEFDVYDSQFTTRLPLPDFIDSTPASPGRLHRS